jgi:hypothetical protein
MLAAGAGFPREPNTREPEPSALGSLNSPLAGEKGSLFTAERLALGLDAHPRKRLSGLSKGIRPRRLLPTCSAHVSIRASFLWAKYSIARATTNQLLLASPLCRAVDVAPFPIRHEGLLDAEERLHHPHLTGVKLTFVVVSRNIPILASTKLTVSLLIYVMPISSTNETRPNAFVPIIFPLTVCCIAFADCELCPPEFIKFKIPISSAFKSSLLIPTSGAFFSCNSTIWVSLRTV